MASIVDVTTATKALLSLEVRLFEAQHGVQASAVAVAIGLGDQAF